MSNKSKNFFKKHYSIIRIIELVFDLFFIVFSFLLVVQVDAFIHSGDLVVAIRDLFSNFFKTYINVFSTQMLYIFIILIFFMVYKVSVMRKTYIETMSSAIIALFVSNVIVIIFSFLVRRVLVSPELIAYTFLSQVIIFGGYKLVLHRFVRKINKRSVLIIGPEEDAKMIATKFLIDKEDRRCLKYLLFEEKLGDLEKLICYIDKVDDVIILHNLDEHIKNNIMTYCLSRNYMDVYLIPKLYEIGIVNSKIDQIYDTSVFLTQSLHLSITQRFIKRTFDIVVSLVGLIISLPIFLIVSILIKLHDKGPVFYKQERTTRGNKPFMLIKFRTMIVDAEKETGAVWQMENDPRITKIGKFLRSTRLDELPQLYNVLKGEMSIIGPRPEREIFIQQFVESIPDFKFRINVKPGITGLAQVQGKYNSTPDDKLRFDLIYIRHYSFLLDLKILFLTVKAVLDKDSSATNTIPAFEEITKDNKIFVRPFTMGLEISEKK